MPKYRSEKEGLRSPDRPKFKVSTLEYTKHPIYWRWIANFKKEGPTAAQPDLTKASNIKPPHYSQLLNEIRTKTTYSPLHMLAGMTKILLLQ